MIADERERERIAWNAHFISSTHFTRITGSRHLPNDSINLCFHPMPKQEAVITQPFVLKVDI